MKLVLACPEEGSSVSECTEHCSNFAHEFVLCVQICEEKELDTEKGQKLFLGIARSTFLLYKHVHFAVQGAGPK